MKKLTVSGRYLRWETGEPFFYLGDTAWELCHRLRADELEVYFSTRAAQASSAVPATTRCLSTRWPAAAWARAARRF